MNFEWYVKLTTVCKKWGGLLLFLLFPFFVSAQEITVSGVITTKSDGLPLPGVNVIVKGTNIGAVSNMDGEYSINVPNPDATLVFSTIGYENQEISVNNRPTINVAMEENIEQLSDVVVVGYGVQKKSDITGAVASVPQERLEKMVSTDVVQLIQGSVAGLNVTATEAGSDPASGANLLIRGRNSISASNDPLIVLDGVPYYGGLSTINPRDIASIEVLKDASSTAIYGSRGANGVILIQTKEGEIGKPTITYNGFYSVQNVANFPHLMTGEEYYQYKIESNLEEGDDEELPLLESEMAVYESGSYKDWTWKDLILRQGNSQRHDLSISGGTEKTTYNASLSFLRTEGIVINDNYKRATSRINLKSEISDWLTYGSNTLLTYADKSGATPRFSDLFNKSPLATPFNEDGSVNIYPIPDDPKKINPIETLLYDDINKRYVISTNNYLDIDLNFIPGLSYRLNTGFQFNSTEKNYYQGINTNASADLKGEAEINEGKGYNYVIENILSFKRSFGKHNLFLTALYSVEEREEKLNTLYASGFPNDLLGWYGAPQANQREPSFNYFKTDLVSQMFRANYSYDSRYLITGTVRRDGYSGFGEKKKYGVFPSVAVGWNISNESFFEGASETFNSLKLRLSYGESGNQAIDPYQTLSRLNQGDYIDLDVPAPGYVPGTLGTPSLGWETTKSLNIGLDYGLFKSRITGEINFYKNETEDLLLKRAISPVHGVDYVFQNIGKTENKGVEFMIKSTNIRTPDFSWSTNFNFTVIDTKIKDLYGDGNDDIANKWFLGEPINVNFDYKFIGIWQEDEADLAAEYGALPGYPKYEDVNDNGVYDPDDRQLIGSPEPDFTWGLTNTFEYKNFSLFTFIYGKEGVLKANPYLERNYLIPREHWTPENPSAKYWSYDSNATRYVGSRGNYPSVYENADFIRVKEITLGYDLPTSFKQSLKLAQAKIYVTGKNLATITDWNALDPELDNQRAIPLQREFLVGLDISF